MKSFELELAELKRLAGISEAKDADGSASPFTYGGSERGEYMKKNKIRPGSDEWFRLWFARTAMTGENPMPKK